MKKLLATPFGSFLKAFVVAILTIMMANYTDNKAVCNDWACWKTLLIAAAFSVVPVIINYLNPKYTQYGIKDEAE